MPSVADLQVVVGADTAPAESALKSFSSSISSGLGIGAGFGAIQAGISALGAVFGAVKGSVIDFNSSLEQSKIGFSSMLGSAKAADEFLGQLQDFAKTTPFEFPELVTASQRMLAFGFQSKQVVPLLTAVGSAAAAMGSGSEGVNRITNALGQMKAATVVQKGELNQLTEAGVPAYDLLAKALGKTTKETMKLVEQGKISSDVFIKAFEEWSQTNFGDMMAKQSHTFAGAMSNIKDVTTQTLATAFRPLFTLVSQGADQFATFLQSDTFSGWAGAAAAGMQGVTDAITAGLAALVPLWTDWIQPIAQTVAGWFSILQSQGLGPFLEAVGQWIVGAVPQLAQSFAGWAGAAVSWLQEVAPGLMSSFTQLLSAVTAWISQAAPTIGATLVAWAQAFWSWAATVGPGLIRQLVTLAGEIVGWIVNTSGLWAASLLEWARAFIEWVTPLIPQLLSALGQVITSIATWIQQSGPGLLQQLGAWAEQFWGWVGPAIPPLLSALANLASTLWQWITQNAGPMLQQLGTWAMAFVNWVAPMIPLLIGTLAGILVKVGGWILDVALPALVEMLKAWAAAFVAWVEDVWGGAGGTSGLFEALGRMVGNLWDWITGTALPAIATKLGEWARAFVDWVANIDYARLLSELEQFVQRVLQGLASLPARLYSAGQDAISSFIRGFTSRNLPSVSYSSSSSGSRGSYEYASGGILREPVAGFGLRSGARYLLGERGPEVVAPLGAGAPWMGGGQTVVNNVTLIVQGNALASKAELADLLVVGLGAAQRQGRTRVRVV